jgi:hypothetical protein
MDTTVAMAASAEESGDRAESHITEIGGRRYMTDARGALVPVDTISARDQLVDEMVRKVIGFALPLSAQIARFKGHTFSDLAALQSLLEQDYGAKAGGAKGNVSLVSFDGRLKIQVQIADQITFGPELQVAKKLVDECLIEWGAQSRAEIAAIVNRAFAVEKEGQIDRNGLFQLLRLDIEDARWKRAMDAIRDSIRILGSKSYIRFYERDTADGAWRGIPIDIAQV